MIGPCVSIYTNTTEDLCAQETTAHVSCTRSTGPYPNCPKLVARITSFNTHSSYIITCFPAAWILNGITKLRLPAQSDVNSPVPNISQHYLPGGTQKFKVFNTCLNVSAVCTHKPNCLSGISIFYVPVSGPILLPWHHLV